MGAAPSLPEMIESLRRMVGFHQEREAFHAQQQAIHAQQEKLHREERARHAAELEAASRHLEELRVMAERLGEVMSRSVAIPADFAEQPLGRFPNLSNALDRVLETWPRELSFSATTVAGEIGSRFGSVLRRSIDVRAISSALRRRRDAGVLQEVREGRPFQEALYRKVT